MKVTFLEDVPNVATAGQTKEVADGYGRNYLLPRKLAVLADSKFANVVESQLKQREKRIAKFEGEMRELAKKIEGIEVTLKARAGEKEQLYGSITSADIAEAVSKAAGYEIEKKTIELAGPIHQLGSYEVPVRLAHEIVPKVKVIVLAEEEAAKPVEEGKKEA
ncbi:MAG: 50S ribosomal protein L9 [Dehalococcoidales bacterium]|nr:50S ribosomal protein L9 [Dehalococcoidales bacterium]